MPDRNLAGEKIPPRRDFCFCSFSVSTAGLVRQLLMRYTLTMKHSRWLSTVLLFSALPCAALALTVADNFNPSIIVSDAAFANTRTFDGPNGIQHFLESKNSVLANTSPSFLTMLAEPNDSALKTALADPEPNLGRLRT